MQQVVGLVQTILNKYLTHTSLTSVNNITTKIFNTVLYNNGHIMNLGLESK